MRITVKHKETEITIDETGNPKDSEKRFISMRWKDESEIVVIILKEIVNQVILLQEEKKQ